LRRETIPRPHKIKVVHTDSRRLLYNALGHRIRISGGVNGTVLYAYDEAGHLLGEYDGTGTLIEETVWLGDMPGPLGLGTCARVLERPPRRRDLVARRAPLAPVTSVGFRVARSQAQEMLASSSLRRVGFEASLELAVVDADHALRRWRLECAPRER